MKALVFNGRWYFILALWVVVWPGISLAEAAEGKWASLSLAQFKQALASVAADAETDGGCRLAVSEQVVRLSRLGHSFEIPLPEQDRYYGRYYWEGEPGEEWFIGIMQGPTGNESHRFTSLRLSWHRGLLQIRASRMHLNSPSRSWWEFFDPRIGKKNFAMTCYFPAPTNPLVLSNESG